MVLFGDVDCLVCVVDGLVCYIVGLVCVVDGLVVYWDWGIEVRDAELFVCGYFDKGIFLFWVWFDFVKFYWGEGNFGVVECEIYL